MRPARLLALLLLAAPASGAADGGVVDGAAPPDLTPPADVDAPRVGAALDRTEAQIGDRLTLTISVIARKSLATSVHVPARLDLGKFELLDESTVDRDLGDGNYSRRFVLQVAAYETGDLELPEVGLDYTTAAGEARSVKTLPIAVRVRSLLAGEEQPQAQPLKAQREVMVEDRRPLVAAAWAVAGLAGLLALWIGRTIVRRRRARPGPIEAAPKRPPAEVALARLDALRRQGDFDRAGYQPFYFELSEILRRFLGARFAFDALELTTSELGEALAEHAAPELAPHREAILDALAGWDLVKFAKAPSDDSAARRGLDAAEALVRATSATSPPLAAAPGRSPDEAADA